MDLLKQWRMIYREIMDLYLTVSRLPNDCPCGDADAHLERRCECCKSSEPALTETKGETCTAQLERLQIDLTVLCGDFSQVAAYITPTSATVEAVLLKRGVFQAANDLQHTAEALERVRNAVEGFRRNCALTEMRLVKHWMEALHEHSEKINSHIESIAQAVMKSEQENLTLNPEGQNKNSESILN